MSGPSPLPGIRVAVAGTGSRRTLSRASRRLPTSGFFSLALHLGVH